MNAWQVEQMVADAAAQEWERINEPDPNEGRYLEAANDLDVAIKHLMKAKAFSKYLLCPRPVIHAIQQSGVALTVEAFGCITGCYGRCQAFIRKLPGVHIPAELNRKVKEQFAAYVENFLNYQAILVKRDTSPLVDLGDYMNGYEE